MKENLSYRSCQNQRVTVREWAKMLQEYTGSNQAFAQWRQKHDGTMFMEIFPPALCQMSSDFSTRINCANEKISWNAAGNRRQIAREACAGVQ